MSRITFETNAERKHNLSKAIKDIGGIRNPVDAKNAFIDACNTQKSIETNNSQNFAKNLKIFVFNDCAT